jgi:branched-chain amino acid transport system permease protein
MIAGGLLAALLAALIGAPVLRLKSDYFAIATLGFSEIVRILVGSSPLNTITNGSLGLNSIPTNPNYYLPFIVVAICIIIIVLLLTSSYGRAFKAIREDEIAAEAMGIRLSTINRCLYYHSFFQEYRAFCMQCISGHHFDHLPDHADLQHLLCCNGGMGSVTGSIIAAYLVTAQRNGGCAFSIRQ